MYVEWLVDLHLPIAQNLGFDTVVEGHLIEMETHCSCQRLSSKFDSKFDSRLGSE